MSAIKQKFNGKPLIEVPKEYPTIGFLEGDFGKEVLNEYKGRAKDYNKHLDILSYKYNIVQGSNPFAVVLMNKVLNEEGLKTASQSDLEKAIKLNALSLNGTYEDTALILRNENNPNSYLAKHLMKQVKERNKKARFYHGTDQGTKNETTPQTIRKHRHANKTSPSQKITRIPSIQNKRTKRMAVRTHLLHTHIKLQRRSMKRQ